MRSLKKRGPHVLDDLMTSYFPYTSNKMKCPKSGFFTNNNITGWGESGKVILNGTLYDVNILSSLIACYLVRL